MLLMDDSENYQLAFTRLDAGQNTYKNLVIKSKQSLWSSSVLSEDISPFNELPECILCPLEMIHDICFLPVLSVNVKNDPVCLRNLKVRLQAKTVSNDYIELFSVYFEPDKYSNVKSCNEIIAWFKSWMNAIDFSLLQQETHYAIVPRSSPIAAERWTAPEEAQQWEKAVTQVGNFGFNVFNKLLGSPVAHHVSGVCLFCCVDRK